MFVINMFRKMVEPNTVECVGQAYTFDLIKPSAQNSNSFNIRHLRNVPIRAVAWHYFCYTSPD
jgi:hypothetical protein